MPQHPTYTGFSQSGEVEDPSFIDNDGIDKISSKRPVPKGLGTEGEQRQLREAKQERLVEAGAVVKSRKRVRVFKGSRDLTHRGMGKNQDKLTSLETQVGST